MGRQRRGRGEGSIHRREDGLWAATLSLGYTAAGMLSKDGLRRDEAGGARQAAVATEGRRRPRAERRQGDVADGVAGG